MKAKLRYLLVMGPTVLIAGALLLWIDKQNHADQGYINRDGKVVIKPQFSEARDFSEGLAAVYMRNKDNNSNNWGFINTSGSVVIPGKFHEADEFSDGLAAVQVGENWGYIDKTGAMKIQPQFMVAGRFHNGLAPVVRPEDNAKALAADEAAEKAGKEDAISAGPGCRLIDKTGKVVAIAEHLSIDPTTRPFHPTARFSEGLLPVTTKDGPGYMGEDGTLKVKGKFYDARAFSEGLAPALVENTMKWGYINKSGKWIIQPKFQDAQPFSEGMAAVGANGLWHFIDHSGKQVFAGEFNTAEPFSEGLAHVRTDEHFGLIDKTGHFILDKTSCAGLHCGLAVAPSWTWADQVGNNSVKTWVVFATQDIKAGQRISESNIQAIDQEAKNQPKGFFSSMKLVAGTKAARSIKAGQQITANDIAKH